MLNTFKIMLCTMYLNIYIYYEAFFLRMNNRNIFMIRRQGHVFNHTKFQYFYASAMRVFTEVTDGAVPLMN